MMRRLKTPGKPMPNYTIIHITFYTSNDTVNSGYGKSGNAITFNTYSEVMYHLTHKIAHCH